MQTGPTKHLTMNEFKNEFVLAKPGQRIIYAVGDLAYSKATKPMADGSRDGAELSGLADLVWTQHILGTAVLTQRRLAENQYEYIATKANPPSQLREALTRPITPPRVIAAVSVQPPQTDTAALGGVR